MTYQRRRANEETKKNATGTQIATATRASWESPGEPLLPPVPLIEVVDEAAEAVDEAVVKDDSFNARGVRLVELGMGNGCVTNGSFSQAD